MKELLFLKTIYSICICITTRNVSNSQSHTPEKRTKTNANQFVHQQVTIRRNISAAGIRRQLLRVAAGDCCDNLIRTLFINHCTITPSLVSVYASTNWNPTGYALQNSAWRNNTLAWRLVQGGEGLANHPKSTAPSPYFVFPCWGKEARTYVSNKLKRASVY